MDTTNLHSTADVVAAVFELMGVKQPTPAQVRSLQTQLYNWRKGEQKSTRYPVSAKLEEGRHWVMVLGQTVGYTEEGLQEVLKRKRAALEGEPLRTPPPKRTTRRTATEPRPEKPTGRGSRMRKIR